LAREILDTYFALKDVPATDPHTIEGQPAGQNHEEQEPPRTGGQADRVNPPSQSTGGQTPITPPPAPPPAVNEPGQQDEIPEDETPPGETPPDDDLPIVPGALPPGQSNNTTEDTEQE